MAGRNTISQRIALEGGDEIRRQFEALGKSGEQAFSRLQQAAGKAVSNLLLVAGAVERVENSFAKVGTAGKNLGTSLGGLNTALDGVGTAMGSVVTRATLLAAGVVAAATAISRYVRSGIQAGDAIGEQAEALGLSTKAFQELGFAALEAGVKSGTFASAIQRLSKNVEKSTTAMAKELLGFAESVNTTFNAPNIKQVGTNFVATLNAVREGAKKVQADLKEAGVEVPIFRIEKQLRSLAEGTVEARQQFERLTGVTLPAARDGLDPLRSLAEKTGDRLRKLGVSFGTLRAGASDVTPVLKELADRFAAMPEGAAKTAAAIDIFGRGAGPKLLPFLNQGSKGIEELSAKMRELGLILSKDEVEASGKAARAFDFLGKTAEITKAKIGAALAPSAERLAEGLSGVNQKFVDFAKSINTEVLPYVDAFFKLLKGEGDDDNQALQQLAEIKGAVVELGRQVQQVFGSVIKPAFDGLVSVFKTAADAINSVFGTNFTAAGLATILVLAKITGAFTLLIAGVRLVGAAFSTFAAALTLIVTSGGLVINILRLIAVALVALVGWPALIAAGLAASIALVATYWEQIKNGATEAFNWVTTKATEAWNFVAQIVSQAASGAWAWISSTFVSAVSMLGDAISTAYNAVVQFVTTAASGAWEWVQDTFISALSGLNEIMTTAYNNVVKFVTTPVASAWEWIYTSIQSVIDRVLAAVQTALAQLGRFISEASGAGGAGTGTEFNPGGFARGGHVRGRGTGTSDSILARLSDGEFVQRAAAVQKYGLDFMEAVNSGRLPKDILALLASLRSLKLGGLVDTLPRFNAGGLVDGFNRSLSALAIPRFAEGGLALAPAGVGQGRNLGTLTLMTTDGQSFKVMTSEDIADKLTRYASMQSLSAAGRNPGWVK